jgi:hypothetical protein
VRFSALTIPAFCYAFRIVAQFASRRAKRHGRSKAVTRCDEFQVLVRKEVESFEKCIRRRSVKKETVSSVSLVLAVS